MFNISYQSYLISAFESQIQSSNKHAEQYKQIAASCEEALKDSNEVFKQRLHLRIPLLE